MSRRERAPSPPPTPPTPADLVLAPELAALALLAHALELATTALLAEHPTLIDDFRRPKQDGPVLTLAKSICFRAATLRATLAAYRRAVRDAAAPPDDASDEELPF